MANGTIAQGEETKLREFRDPSLPWTLSASTGRQQNSWNAPRPPLVSRAKGQHTLPHKPLPQAEPQLRSQRGRPGQLERPFATRGRNGRGLTPPTCQFPNS